MAGASIAVGRTDMSAEPLRGLHILVVDEDATARNVIAAILEHGGALVSRADSADAAWQSLARVLPEVIVCGLSLDESRAAHALLQRIRTLSPPRGRDVPIIAIARGYDNHPVNELLEAGFAGFIKTPLEPLQLCELIAEVADAHPREGGCGE
jgi:CheY-like chemotaxis protein